MSHQPERALTPLSTFHMRGYHPQRRNESSAREGIDTTPSISNGFKITLVEMSHQPERALTPNRNCMPESHIVTVEMSHQPERALNI